MSKCPYCKTENCTQEHWGAPLPDSGKCKKCDDYCGGTCQKKIRPKSKFIKSKSKPKKSKSKPKHKKSKSKSKSKQRK